MWQPCAQAFVAQTIVQETLTSTARAPRVLRPISASEFASFFTSPVLPVSVPLRP